MKRSVKGIIAIAALLAAAAGAVNAADAKPATLTCVGIYSETSDGYISARTAGTGAWVPVKVGDVIPANGEIKINVERDWIEVIKTGSPNAVFEIAGPASGETVLKVADVLKGKSRTVSFPKGTVAKPDPKYKDKLVVAQYLGRQIYVNADGDSNDIKYGDVLDIKGKVKIIAINNTVNLMNASNGVTTVVGPLTFTIEQILSNKSLYKFLNVQK